MSGENANIDGSKRPVVVTLPLNWTQLNLSEQAKSIRFVEDKDGNIWAYPVVLVDPTTPDNSGNMIVRGPVAIRDGTNASLYANVAYTTFARTLGDLGLVTVSVPYVYNPALGVTGVEVLRTPSKFKNLETAVAPATAAIWAPGAGVKFRLMGGTVCMGGTIAAAAKRSLKLVEETTATVIAAFGIDIPILGGNIAFSFNMGPNGYLASAADLDLQVITAGATYVTGSDWVTVWGTEE